MSGDLSAEERLAAVGRALRGVLGHGCVSCNPWRGGEGKSWVVLDGSGDVAAKDAQALVDLLDEPGADD